MDTRIEELISTLKISKTKFASQINVSSAFISQVCSGVRTPSDRTISDICREFNVNEAWLRTGEGEMFVTQTRAEEIEGFIKEILQEDSDFRRRLVSVLARMTPDEWELLERKAREIFEETQKTSPTPTRDAEEDYLKNFGSAGNGESTASSSIADTPKSAGEKVG